MTREHSLHLYKTWESKSLECRALFQQNAFFIAYSSMCQEYMGKKTVSAEKELLHVPFLPYPARL